MDIWCRQFEFEKLRFSDRRGPQSNSFEDMGDSFYVKTISHSFFNL